MGIIKLGFGAGVALAAMALAGIAAADTVRVINNSETATAQVQKPAPGAAPTGGPAGVQTNLGATPVNGIGGTGGGRYTFKPTTAPAGGSAAFPTNLGATPVNGVGGTGGGRLTAQPPSARPTTATQGGRSTVDSSNRDHIDQDAQVDIRR